MDQENPRVSDLSREEARALIVRDFDLMIHDLSCHCAKADPACAGALLLQAAWTVKDAFGGWQGAWLSGEFDA